MRKHTVGECSHLSEYAQARRLEDTVCRFEIYFVGELTELDDEIWDKVKELRDDSQILVLNN